jgi:type IV pilus assembly protein PilP
MKGSPPPLPSPYEGEGDKERLRRVFTVTGRRPRARGAPPAARARALLALPLAVALTACGGGDLEDLQEFVEQVKARGGGRIEPLPEIKVPEIFAYQVQDQQDPFRPFAQDTGPEVVASRGGGIAPPQNHIREELEQFPLDSLRMVGTVEKSDQVWGLVTAPDGAVHRVQPGNYAGKNYGKITLVADDRIELTEIIADGLGGWQERQARMDLSE